ncbi:MAG: hypothetical protein ACRC33_06905 [Gemmataceae bacterium]
MIAVCLLLFAADDAKAARSLLDRAVAALGGAKALSAPHALTGRSKGTLHVGPATELKNAFTVQGLDRMKWETEINAGTLVLGLNKSGMWVGPNDVTKETALAFRRGFAALRIAETPVVLLGKGWKLSSLGELALDGGPALGLKASRAGEPDLDLWFDKETALPVKVELRLQKPGESAETALSAVLGDYRKSGVRQHFGKMTVYQDGAKVLDVERTEVKAVDPVDDATFDKP